LFRRNSRNQEEEKKGAKQKKKTTKQHHHNRSSLSPSSREMSTPPSPPPSSSPTNNNNNSGIHSQGSSTASSAAVVFGNKDFSSEEKANIRNLLQQRLGKEHLATRQGAGGGLFTKPKQIVVVLKTLFYTSFRSTIHLCRVVADDSNSQLHLWFQWLEFFRRRSLSRLRAFPVFSLVNYGFVAYLKANKTG